MIIKHNTYPIWTKKLFRVHPHPRKGQSKLALSAPIYLILMTKSGNPIYVWWLTHKLHIFWTIDMSKSNTNGTCNIVPLVRFFHHSPWSHHYSGFVFPFFFSVIYLSLYLLPYNPFICVSMLLQLSLAFLCFSNLLPQAITFVLSHW